MIFTVLHKMQHYLLICYKISFAQVLYYIYWLYILLKYRTNSSIQMHFQLNPYTTKILDLVFLRRFFESYKASFYYPGIDHADF